MSDELRGWEFVCTEAELLPGEKKTVWDGDTPILVVNLDGVYYAVEDQCTHEDFELSAGPYDQATGQIECVLHGESHVAWFGDVPLVIVNFDGIFYALEDRCTHEDFELSAGHFDAAEGSVECVLHGARFDIRDGRALCAPAYEPVAKFPVKVEDGRVLVRDDR